MSLSPLLLSPRLRVLPALLLASVLWVDYVPDAAPKPLDPLPPSASLGARDRLAQLEGQPCDLIFIGASNIEFFTTTGRRVWERYYGSRHTLNFGTAGDTTGLALQRLDDPGLRRLHPKVAVIFIGLNNLADTPSQVADGITAVAGKAGAIFPGVHVIVVSLTPNARNDAGVVQTNAIVRGRAASHHFTYLDLYSHLPRSGQTWIGLGEDRLHLNEHGYAIWARQMEPLLERLLTSEPPRASVLASKRESEN